MPKLTRKEKEASPTREDLVKRVANAKGKLPPSGVSSFFINNYPEYDTVKGRSKVNNVLQFRVTDEDVTVKLEAIAAKNQPLK
jgi:hypothetical protein